MIRYKCPACKATLESPSSLAGKTDLCPLCGISVPVPAGRSRRGLLLLALGGGGALVAAVIFFLPGGRDGPGPAESDRGFGPRSVSVTFASQEELARAEKVVEEKALALLKRLSVGPDPAYHATKELLRLRPLPSRAVGDLIALLKSPDKTARSYAALVLAYHQRDVKAVLSAIRSAREAEQDEKTGEQMDCAIQALETVSDETTDLPVLAIGDQLAQWIEGGVLGAARVPGRSYGVSTMAGGGHSHSTKSPDPEDLPEVVTLQTPGGPCRAELGWAWEIEWEDDERSIHPVPVGALMRIRDRLTFNRCELQAGTILLHTTRGWGVVEPAQAVARVKAGLRLKRRLWFRVDNRTLAPLGCCLLAEHSGSLVRDLAEAVQSMDGFMDWKPTILCIRAIERVGTRNEIPVLQEMKKKLDSPRSRKAVDAAIAAIEKR